MTYLVLSGMQNLNLVRLLLLECTDFVSWIYDTGTFYVTYLEDFAAY